jgi:hypothetical protein
VCEDEQAEHQAGEKACPRLLEAEEDELGKGSRQPGEAPADGEAERIEERSDGMALRPT